MNTRRYILEPYKSPASRYRCPACRQPRQFARYIDKETGGHIADDVGRCNRASKCGYHKTPRDHFSEHPQDRDRQQLYRFTAPAIKAVPRPIDFLPVGLVDATRRKFEQNNLWQFFARIIGRDAATLLFEKYNVGTASHWPGATAFWQIDEQGRPRQCKVMQFDPATGKRVKRDGQTFIAFMGKQILGKPDANLQQCFFGCHLLPLHLLAPVAIVESEKTAMYCAHYFPDYVWLATGGKQGCRWTEKEVLAVLKDRTIVLFPDADATADWQEKARKVAETIRCRITVCTDIEKRATDAQRAGGWDLMDFHLQDQQGQEKPLQDEAKGESPPRREEVIFHHLYARRGPGSGDRPTHTARAGHTGPTKESWMQDIEKLKTYFDSVTLPTGPLIISPGCTIVDLPTFITNSLATVQANDGKKTFLPCLERLKALQQIT